MRAKVVPLVLAVSLIFTALVAGCAPTRATPVRPSLLPRVADNLPDGTIHAPHPDLVQFVMLQELSEMYDTMAGPSPRSCRQRRNS